jgi:hypothetical protein
MVDVEEGVREIVEFVCLFIYLFVTRTSTLGEGALYKLLSISSPPTRYLPSPSN